MGCGKCGVPCGPGCTRYTRIWNGVRWCERCWRRIGERKWIKWIKWHTKRGHVRLDYRGMIAWRISA